MEGLEQIRNVQAGLNHMQLPLLMQPKPLLNAEQARFWETRLYCYAVLAHLRAVLDGLVQLGASENYAASHIISSHLMEWTAQVCHISAEFGVIRECADCCRPRPLGVKAVSPAAPTPVTGHSKRKATAPARILVGAFDCVELLTSAETILRYECYQDDAYEAGHGSGVYEFVSGCCTPTAMGWLREYQGRGNTVKLVGGVHCSPLPIVSWCLADLLTFLHALLSGVHEEVVREQLELVFGIPIGVPLKEAAPADTVSALSLSSSTVH